MGVPQTERHMAAAGTSSTATTPVEVKPGENKRHCLTEAICPAGEENYLKELSEATKLFIKGYNQNSLLRKKKKTDGCSTRNNGTQ